MKGKGHWHYRGGRYVDGDGYVRVMTEDGYQLEHRVVMAKKLRRKLRPNEIVKHRDGKTQNNRLSNLYIERTTRSARPAAKRRRAA